jgi:hypothetical protein
VIFSFGLTTALAIFVIVAALCMMTSKTAIERLVAIGVLPRVFINAVPLLTIGGRVLAVAMLLFGGIELGFATGALSTQWLQRYGFSSFLVVLGAVLLLVTFRKAK